MKFRTGRSLLALRKQRKLSQYALAAAAGVSRGTVSEWEVGRRPIPAAKKPVVATILGVAEEALDPAPPVKVVRRRRVVKHRPPYPPGADLSHVYTLGPAFSSLVNAVREALSKSELDELASFYPRDTREEMILVLNLLKRGGRVIQTCLQDWNCPVHSMHDLLETPANGLLQPAIEWRHGEERLIVFGQVWLLISRHAPVRVDFLVRYERAGHPPIWFFVEIDDSGHKDRVNADAERDAAIVLPGLRYENYVTHRPGFFERFLEDIRRVPALARKRIRERRRKGRLYEADRQKHAAKRRAVA